MENHVLQGWGKESAGLQVGFSMVLGDGALHK